MSKYERGQKLYLIDEFVRYEKGDPEWIVVTYFNDEDSHQYYVCKEFHNIFDDKREALVFVYRHNCERIKELLKHNSQLMEKI